MEAVDGSRSELRWYHYVGDFFNILKAFIGTNYQAVPFAFSQSGIILGVIGVLVIASLTNHCCQLMVRCKYYAIEKIILDERERGKLSEDDLEKLETRLGRALGYGDVGKHLFGTWAYHIIQAAVFLTQFATGVAYFIFIGNTIYQMYPVYTPLSNTTVVNASAVDVSVKGVAMLNLFKLTHDDTSFSGDYPLHVEPLINVNNISTVTPPSNTTTTTSAPPWSTLIPSVYALSEAPDLRIVVLYPLAFFILTAFIRKMRWLAPFSTIATIALAIGAISVFGYMAFNLSVSDTFVWVRWTTLPIFIGQLISAYEGIGCIIPIESSMEGNRKIFPAFMYFAVYIVCSILICFGVFGYLNYGDSVQQLVVLDMKQHTFFSIFVDVTLIISVLFTYPLQVFPVMEITEAYLLAPGKIFGPRVRRQFEYDAIDEQMGSVNENSALLAENNLEASLTASTKTGELEKVSPWRRNIIRIIITLMIAGCAILLRNAYAYLGAFTGAVGASLLAFIIPCAAHLKVKHNNLSWKNIVKDWSIIILSTVSSFLTIGVIVQSAVSGKAAF